ncbi:MAG: ATP-dependent DNA helicase [Clostridia bacterium]|nr:ATP-dependent DNA helicase [Clostridia bacterium]
MFFEKKEQSLYISVEELLAAAWFCYNDTTDDEEPLVRCLPAAKEGGFSPVALEERFSAGEVAFCLKDTVAVKEGDVFLPFTTTEDPARLSAAAKKRIRGIGFLYAYLLKSDTPPRLLFTVSRREGEVLSWEEAPSAASLSAFWRRAIAALATDSRHAIEKAAKRLPTLAALSFPYGEARDGQGDMMKAVFSAVKHKSVLYAAAPTGIGKTLATLFPALRALGMGYTEKIFYFVPKTTLFATARDTLTLLAQKGARLLGIVLYAKDRLCPYKTEGTPCRFCPHGKNKKEAMRQATEALYQKGLAVVEEEMLLSVALEYGVCPHELALSYARYADVVICDYNYLFDRKCFLRRFFTQKGHYTFLIDEAHNLPDRAREMYSATLSPSVLEGLREMALALHSPIADPLARLSAATESAIDEMLKDTLRQDAEGEQVGFAHQSQPPLALADALEAIAEARDKAIYALSSQKDAKSQLLRAGLYELSHAADVLLRYGTGYVTYALQEKGEKKIKFTCIDPSEEINERLDKGDSAIFFSATLSPIDYYRSVLTARRPALSVEEPSPFAQENLCVGIMDKVSVRAVAREESLAEVAKIIATTLREKQGNYMVFCPSFAYMERVAEAFRRLAPKVTVALQRRHMTPAEREAFLAHFKPREKGYFVGFCVTGGLYAEGIDLVGERLIGAIVVGVALPQVSAERELICAYYAEKCEMGKEYAYLYPGMNRILQAAGRVIRREDDRGVVVLIDDRFRSPICRKVFPQGWHGLKYAGNREALAALLHRFWQEE